MKARFTLSVVALIVCAGFLLGEGKAFGYAGEPGAGDGSDPNYQNLTLSTHHTHLTRALAYCAGLPGRLDVRNPVNPLLSQADAQLAETLGLYDELTDQGTIVGADGTGPVWTNINTTDWTYQLPSPESLGCTAGANMVYPVLVGTQPEPLPDDQFFDPTKGWFTNRFGPWAPQFHFPTEDDLARTASFAKGNAEKLNARSEYAWGATNFWAEDGTCYKTRQEDLATGSMTKGSVAAFATYLHSIGDSHSHGICRESWAQAGRQAPPWYFHVPVNLERLVGCPFNAHTLEFGCADTTERARFIAGTVDGAVAVFNALIEYSGTHNYTPRIRSADEHGQWLRRQIQRYAMMFETNVSSAGGACRVSYTWALMKACEQYAAADPGSCLPDVDVDADDGTCSSSARTNCPNGTQYYPLAGANCTPTAPPAQATAASR
ncbi:MAG TPA: hypothetical protein DD490_18925 [Acidobacteria bacterium]|nr:hypothetical protein [Acidobacteriota bacterium]